MPAKKKPAPAPSPTWGGRTAEVVRAHPKITWGTAAAVVSILGVLTPGYIWWEDRYQRKEAARLAEERIRSEIKDQTEHNARNRAWLLAGQATANAGQARLESVIMRNRVVECREKMAGQKSISTYAASVCAQYEAELKDAQDRTEVLAREAAALKQQAMDSTREKM